MLTFGLNYMLAAVSHSRKLSKKIEGGTIGKNLYQVHAENFFKISTFLPSLRLGTINLEKITFVYCVILKSALVQQVILSGN